VFESFTFDYQLRESKLTTPSNKRAEQTLPTDYVFVPRRKSATPKGLRTKHIDNSIVYQFTYSAISLKAESEEQTRLLT
jgi:hypothetical protein